MDERHASLADRFCLLDWRLPMVNLRPILPFLAALCALAMSAFARADESARMAVKRLYAPSSDVERGIVRLPAPEATPTRSPATVLTGAFERGGGGASRVLFRFEHGGGLLRLLPLGADAARWRMRVTVGAQCIPLEEVPGKIGAVTERFASQSFLRIDGAAIEDATRLFELEVPAGPCTLECVAALPEGAPAALIVADSAEVSLCGHLGSRIVRAGGALELVVRGESPAHGVAAEIGLAGGVPREVAVADAQVTWSDGMVERATAVEVRADGSARVVFARAHAGDALVRIDGAVRDASGAWRQRSLAYATRVVDGALLTGGVRAEASDVVADGGWVDFAIGIEHAAIGSVVFAATELWADDRPLGWIGGLAEVEQGVGGSVVRLGVARSRIALRDGERLALRNLRLHERDGFAPLDLRAEAEPEVRVALQSKPSAQDGDLPVEVADWGGLPGIATVPVPAISSFVPPIGAHALVLTHGYCADANPWPAAQFGADAWRYEQPNQNLSHDAFAVDIATRAAQFKSYGVVGHSQGGCAALHLYAYYWSGLDWAGPGRLMQCVGSPLEGTALAGNIAVLGQVFGIQCGANYDLTYDGAAAWLSGIPAAARAKLYTHTTTFTNVPFFYDYCSIASDILLSDPEDGVTEDFSGHIVGGVNMGLRTGWCHVSGMRDPAQTGDSNRNATMNAQGAR